MLSFIKRIKVPHVFVLLTGVVFVCSIFTYIISSGEYEREIKKVGTLTRNVVIPGTYKEIPKHISQKGVIIGDMVEGEAPPVSVFGFLSAIPRGMEEAADNIFFIFIIGGVFGILQCTGTIMAFIQKLLDIFGQSACSNSNDCSSCGWFNAWNGGRVYSFNPALFNCFKKTRI